MAAPQLYATENKYNDNGHDNDKEMKKEENVMIDPMIDLLENINIDPVQVWYGSGGWLPGPLQISLWRKKLIAEDIDLSAKLKPSVQCLADLIKEDESVNKLASQMIHQSKSFGPKLAMPSIEVFLHGINYIIQTPIKWQSKGELIGIPLSAWFSGVDATLAGQTLFRYPSWNKCLKDILCAFNRFLDTPESWPKEGNSWLTKEALEDWGPLLTWKKQEQSYPYWKSWNHWFGRGFHDQDIQRPVAGKDNANIITSTNDGVEFRWRSGIKLCDKFWLKHMSYSLTDIFGGGDLADKYAERFVGGSIFQTFLNPFNYHCWWSPVSGKIVDATVLPGYFYSKLVIPDIDGSTTASCPYLAQVNARGIVIIDTKGYANIGYVCCIPIGMCEVSSIVYESDIKKGSNISKGQKIGKFQFGGSSFAIIFENTLKYKKLITFMADHNLPNTNKPYFPMNAPAPSVTGNDKSIKVNVGQQIAVVTDLNVTDRKSVV